MNRPGTTAASNYVWDSFAMVHGTTLRASQLLRDGRSECSGIMSKVSDLSEGVSMRCEPLAKGATK